MDSQYRLFAQTRPAKLFFIAAIPGAISMLASSLYQTLDGMFVGQGLGSVAFAALNLAMPFVIINFAVADLIGVGSSVPISINLGQGNKDEANRIFSLSVLMILISAVALGGLLFLSAPLLMTLMGADGLFRDYAVLYLRVYALFSPLTTLTFALDNYLRICGKVKTSMGLNIAMSVTSAVLEMLFIFVFGWGIWSAALATCLGMTVVVVSALVPFALGRRALRFVRPRFSKAVVRRIIASGTPSFLNNIAGRLTSIVFNMMLVRMGGQDAVSTYGVLMYADGLVQPILYGTCDSLQPAIGYNWGAGLKSRARSIEKCCIAASLVISLTAATLIHTFPGLLASIFVDGGNLPLLEEATGALTLFSFAFLFRWISFSSQSFFLAIEMPIQATTISISTALVFPMIMLFALQGLGLTGIWLNFASVNALSAILSIILVASKWKTIMAKDTVVRRE